MGLRIFHRAAQSGAIVAFATLLSACGDTPSSAAGAASTQSIAMTVDLPPNAGDASALVAQPAFHVAPVLLDPPSDTDATDPNASASVAPHTQAVPVALSYLSTRRLTLGALTDAAAGRMTIQEATPNEVATPMASGMQVATYTPAQIRAAYGLPPLSSVNTTPTAMQAVQMGAGQTVYIIDSNNDPNAAAELAAFNQTFGLPGCVTTAILPATKLPLPAAPTTGCTFSVVYSTSSGAMTSTIPAYDAGWQTEIALDVQWVHATAPMARIVLIEAPNATQSNLLGAIALANAMGPGVVSMSFGAPEGSWTSAVDAYFTAANMTYIAATGDSGAGVEWPAVSSHVLGVGGTSLSYTPGAARSETAWSDGGGGISQYTPTPSYQTVSVPGMGAFGHRAISDVSFNSNPATGQYVVVLIPGSNSPGWLSAGGTSLATPQWAGLIAMANAERAQAGKQVLGQPHALLYGQISVTPATYAGAFADITVGSDGSCNTCVARIGYDTPTGLGTPNGTELLGILSGSGASSSVAPVVSSASISGIVGSALSFTVSVTAAHPVTFALSNAPSGMAVNTSGVVSWPKPVAGSFAVTIVATDTKTNLTGKGVFTVTIAQAGPIIMTAPMSGVAGRPMSGTITITDATSSSLAIGISGVPIGMSFSNSGLTITASWAKPVTGSYVLQVLAQDANGKKASASFPVTVTTH